MSFPASRIAGSIGRVQASMLVRRSLPNTIIPQWQQLWDRRRTLATVSVNSEKQQPQLPPVDPSLPFVSRLHDVPGYSPANHTGTVNRRLIDPVTVGSHALEVLHGTLSATGEHKARALPHYHPNMDQAVYILSGRAMCRTLVPSKAGETIEGTDVWREEIIEKGDSCFFARGVVHEVIALGGDEVLEKGKGTKDGEGKLQLLVMYSPPYMEDPKNKTVVWTGKMK